MKPKRIILVRHGESEGNIDPAIYEHIPDWRICLTEKGEAQAILAGVKVKNLIRNESLKVYSSPYYRTRETLRCMRDGGIDDNITRITEDPRLREQDWGHTGPIGGRDAMVDKRNEFSTFYYRLTDGESGADVYDRVSTFFETMHRDFKKKDFPENVLVVTHGMTLRLFLMRWLHWSVEEFEDVRNPLNGQIFVMNKKDHGRYELETELRYRSDTNE